MGGEPLLRIEDVHYILDSIDSRKKLGSWNCLINTNGYLLKDDNLRNLLLNKIRKLSFKCSLQISFDGSGHNNRKLISRQRNI